MINRNSYLLASKILLLAGVLMLATPLSAQRQGDLIFQVLQDELDRNTSLLVMKDLVRPYFISYTVDDYQQLETRSSLGTITRSSLERGRYLTVDLRVGDYSLDNSNFVSGFSGFGPSFFSLSLDDNYDAVRNEIYLATDEVYKGALETLSKKRAYLQTRVITSRPDDLVKLPPNRQLDKPETFDITRESFEDLAKAASAVFRGYPAIMASEIKVTAAAANQYFLNSTGSKTLRGDRIYGFELSMSGKTKEGEDVIDGDRMIVQTAAGIPTKDALVSWTRNNAEKMVKLINADTLDDYIGPVIFTEDAAGEFFRQLFAKFISNLPSPTYENDQMASMAGAGEFAGKLNRRVLPSSFTVYDDPTMTKSGTAPVIGSYSSDDAGAVPKRVTLVESGKLVNFLIGIAPTKKIKEPNGHARGAVSKAVTAKPSNLVFESTERVPYEKLKEELINACKDVDLPYGLIIKKIRDYSAPAGGFQFFGQQQGSESGLTYPYEIYRVYTDGREELVRGLQFNNVTVRILKDILQTDDRQYVYNYLIGNDYEMPATIVCPSVLVEEMELKKSEAKVKKPPLLPSPLAGN